MHTTTCLINPKHAHYPLLRIVLNTKYYANRFAHLESILSNLAELGEMCLHVSCTC